MTLYEDLAALLLLEFHDDLLAELDDALPFDADAALAISASQSAARPARGVNTPRREVTAPRVKAPAASTHWCAKRSNGSTEGAAHCG